MQPKISAPQLTLGLALLTTVASAQSHGLTHEDLVCPCLHPVNRFGLSYRPGFNIAARFKNIGGYTSPNNPGAAIAGIDHFYDDGYNRVDTGTNSNFTWFWGYESASQLPGNGTVVMSSSSAAGGSSGPRKDEPQHGIELTYNRELGHYEKWRWGIETAFGYTDVSIGNNGSTLGAVTRISDAYVLGGAFPPAAPYHGTKEGPGFLIGTTPDRTVTTIAGGASISGNRQFNADIYGLRVGPYLELPLDDRWAVSFSGGLSLLSVNSDFKFRETVSLAGLPSQTSRGNGSHSDILPGAYIGGNVLYALLENVSLFAGAQFQSAGTYSHKESGKEVELDLRKSVFLNVGVGFSF